MLEHLRKSNIISNTPLKFSAFNRAEDISKISEDHFDLVVIGGGITGCGIALDAASRGIKTLLIEKEDFASGTSSKSTKLIHGGLRYLKQFEIGLVKETGTERAIVHKLAPHLVHPEKMLLPIVKGGTFGKLSASFAIMVYDLLAGVNKEDKRKPLTRKTTKEAEPLLSDNLLKSGITYSEYRTDDARLTIELIKTARRHGAAAFNYAEAKDFIYADGKVVGVSCYDHLNNISFNVNATQVVSAAGPWVDKLRAKDGSKKGKSLHLTKGVHVVVPKAKLPLNQSVYFDAFDGRMIFAIPRGAVTYLGTSDTNYSDSLDRVVSTISDAKYLLGTVNTMFPSVNLKVEDVVSSWAGLRPLIHEDGKSPSELSRKDEIFISDSGLISIAGGKLTGYRKMSERVVDTVMKKMNNLKFVPCKTKTIKLAIDPFDNYSAVKEYITILSKEMEPLGFTKYDAWYLTTTYGKDARMVLDRFLEDKNPNKDEGLIDAELWYNLMYESVATPVDFFARRTGRIYFDVDSVKSHMQRVAKEIQNTFTWNSETLADIHEELEDMLEDATIFYDSETVV